MHIWTRYLNGVSRQCVKTKAVRMWKKAGFQTGTSAALTKPEAERRKPGPLDFNCSRKSGCLCVSEVYGRQDGSLCVCVCVCVCHAACYRSAMDIIQHAYAANVPSLLYMMRLSWQLLHSFTGQSCRQARPWDDLPRLFLKTYISCNHKVLREIEKNKIVCVCVCNPKYKKKKATLARQECWRWRRRVSVLMRNTNWHLEQLL